MPVAATSRLVTAASMAATVSTVFPGFLIGALAVQVSDEFDVAEATYGWGLGGFFLGATIGSIALGRVAQRVGPRRQVSAAIAVSAACQLFIAVAADRFALVIGALAVAGLANAANQTAVNLLLAEARLNRLGLAIALKQSGMPTASLLSGFAVPVVALTVGWRWAYVLGAGFALAALVVVRTVVAPIGRVERARSTPASNRRSLLLAALGGVFLAFAAGALNAWLVASGVEAGLGEGAAGLLLALGAMAGIAMRLFLGWRIDRSRSRPFAIAAGLSVIGGLGVTGLALEREVAHVAATVLAFGAGWVWPVFTNFGIVRTNARAAAAATGITQMGVYVGVFASPLVTGWIIETRGYPSMWLVVAAAMWVGSILAWLVRDDF